MGKDFVDLSPQELDDHLRSEGDLDLHIFSELAFEVVRWKKIFPERKLHIKDAGFVDDGRKYDGLEFCERVGLSQQTDRRILISLKKKINNLKTKIIDTMLELEALLGQEHDRRREDTKSEAFIKRFESEYEIEQFFGLLQDYKLEIEDLMQKSNRGAPINRRNLLCAVWAQYILEHKRGLDWNLIADLMDWFWARFRPYRVYRDFKSLQDQTQPEYLKNQFYKQKKRWIWYYQAIMPRPKNWVRDSQGAEIIVFGREPKEIDHSIGFFMEGIMRGEMVPYEGPLWDLAAKIYRSRTKSPRKKDMGEALDRAKQARLDWLIVFPDNTYAIDPK